MCALYLISFAFGLGLGLRYRAFVLLLVQFFIVVAAVIMVFKSGQTASVVWAAGLSSVAIQVGYFITGFWAEPQRPPLRLSAKKI